MDDVEKDIKDQLRRKFSNAIKRQEKIAEQLKSEHSDVMATIAALRAGLSLLNDA